MSRILLILFMLLSPIAWAEVIQSLHSLSELKWKNRLILINAGDDINTYQDELSQRDAEINDRDIVWFLINQSSLSTNYTGTVTDNLTKEVRQKLQHHNSLVLLMGKDGGVKATDTQLRLHKLFSEIDSMPMRQRELQHP
ncbi:hypothetical protein GCM10007891_22890 [Methylophaga thalassica]|uniref:DUF4174 domain-containing protein n=1 Tax=Methylophaga thalassica TaxID=40223 RepID=A0ABQ5TXD4_9GAMM|nr:DUF4174 domain-containing protein [Methylophaga thalassica]GLQ00436.1 hypothetical protein GCM10007891_22890 [Methylophaga thalassica]